MGFLAVAPLYERRKWNAQNPPVTDRRYSGSLEPEAVYKEIVTSGPRKLADLMQALLAFLGRNDMMAYLVMVASRLVEFHHVPMRTCTPGGLICNTALPMRNFELSMSV